MTATSVLGKVTPRITKMIRADHTHVTMLFHKYQADASPEQKRSIVEAACLALEIHAQLEEETFYPALREVMSNEMLDKAKPEHDEMRRLIAQLRGMAPTDPAYDETFMQLVRAVLHHVADEESVLLPGAERLLRERLGDLGVQMTRRRIQLAGPHLGEMAVHSARAMPGRTMLFASGLLAGGYLLGRSIVNHRRH
jgi:hemerythrin superfamily protein